MVIKEWHTSDGKVIKADTDKKDSKSGLFFFVGRQESSETDKPENPLPVEYVNIPCEILAGVFNPEYQNKKHENDWISKSILIRYGNPNNITLLEIFNPVGVTVRDNTVIVRQVCPILPYRIDETEVCRFRDAFVASQAYDVVDKAIREGWDYVDLIPQYNAAGGWAFIESAAALPD